MTGGIPWTMRVCKRVPNPGADARIWLCTVWILSCAGPLEAVPVEDGRLVMGTVLDLALLVRPGEEGRAREALALAFDSVSSLERVASRYVEESDVRRLNARAGRGDVEIDARVHALLVRAEEARRLTRSAFDVTVGPLVALWTRAVERAVVPDEAEIAAAVGLVGRPVALGSFHSLGGGDRARLDEVGMSIDLGGIAKGFALDAVAADLRAAGFGRGLLSFGQSSVWALGAPADAPRWRLAVQDDEGGVLGVIELSDRALSVSSSFGRSSEIAGRRYGHVVDPRTGLAISEARRAIVMARDATLAETLSTALLILSEKEGREVVDAQDAEALVLREDGSSWETSGWAEISRFQSSIASGSSRRRFTAASSCAPTAPSTARWSAESVQIITLPTAISPLRTTGFCRPAPTPRMQLWGGFTMGVLSIDP